MKAIQLTDTDGTVLHSRRVSNVNAERIRYARIVFPRGGYPRIAELWTEHRDPGAGSWTLPVIAGKVRLPV